MNRNHSMGALILACCVMASVPVAAQLTGTLFTSPEQREYLDYLRQEFLASSSERGFDITEAEIPDIPVAVAEAEAAGPVVYTLGGIISLRDGTQRIWLNGKALSESELPDGISITEQNGARMLTVTHEGRSYLLKPGQSLELGSTQGPQERYAFVQRPQVESNTESTDSLTSAQTNDPDDSSQAGLPVQDSVPASTMEPTADGEVSSTASLTESIMALNPAEIEGLIEALEQAKSGTDADLAAELEDDDAE